jgi:hypothetical protein
LHSEIFNILKKHLSNLKENCIAEENCMCFGELKEKGDGKWIEVA